MIFKAGLGRIGLFLGACAGLTGLPAADEPAGVVLSDVSGRSGVAFRFDNGSRGKHDLPEIMGGGLALLDGDGDGRLDLYLCNGGPIAGADNDSPCRYYRNNGDGTFTDSTEAAHAPGPSYAMGAAAADYDGDGRVDLFVTGWRDRRLYRNLGGGRFADVTEAAGLQGRDWTTSAAWADLDADGDLDLFVAAYLDYDPDNAPYCAAPDGRRDYCGPVEFTAQPDHLYRNNGDGTFTDVSRPSGVALPDGRGLGVIVADLVGGPRPDIFVANDGSECHLFENLGDLKFRESGVASGLAFDGQGEPLAGMGVACADVDADGRLDLAVGNFLGRSTVLFRGQAGGGYRDDSSAFGLSAATRGVNGFGLALTDLDADGAPDLIQANGHVVDRLRLGVPFAMRPTLLRNEGRRFVAPPPSPSGWSARPTLGRGLAVGDLDNDGRPDVVFTALDAPPTLLRNASRGRSVALELVGRSPLARTPFGARVTTTVAGRTVVQALPGGGSYLSSSDPRLFLAVRNAPRVDRVEVAWPDGLVEAWCDVVVVPALRLTEGTGRPASRTR